jgi:hypothetical protein
MVFIDPSQTDFSATPLPVPTPVAPAPAPVPIPGQAMAAPRRGPMTSGQHQRLRTARIKGQWRPGMPFPWEAQGGGVTPSPAVGPLPTKQPPFVPAQPMPSPMVGPLPTGKVRQQAQQQALGGMAGAY